MTRWCSNLLLVAAMAATAPGCAHVAGARRVAMPDGLPAPMPDVEQKAATDSVCDAVPAVAPGAMPENGLAREEMRNVAPGAEPQATPADTPEDRIQKLTLEYLSRLAVENHPLLRRNGARIESASGQALQAGLYPNPIFDTNNPQIFNGPLGTALNAGFQQEIVVKGKLRLDRAAALRAQQQSEYALVQDHYALLAQVRNQFYQTLAAQYRVDVLNRLLTITAAGVKAAEARVQGTIGDKTEVLLLTIDYDRTQADLTNALRMLDGERKQLAAIVGFPELADQKVIGSLTARTPTFDEDSMQQFVTSENAQVQIAKLEVDRNKIVLQRAEVEPYPNITIGPAYQYGLNHTQDQFWMTVVFPIPVSNRNQGNIQSARADIRDSVETLGSVQLDLLRRLADSYSTHRGALAQAEQYRTQIIPEAREALRLVKSAYDPGLAEFSVYLQAQRTMLNVTKDYVDILERVWTTAADLSGILQMDKFP